MNNKFGNKIKELRLQRKLSQQYVANRLEISQTALSSYEIGRIEPSFSVVEMFAEFYHVSPYSLLPFEMGDGDAKLFEISDTISRNPKLLSLFDRIKGMPDATIDAILAVANAFIKENERHE